MTIAPYAIEGKFHHPPPGASANEMTIAPYAIEGKFHHPPPEAS
ncbi:MAG: hypothetical protein AAGJ08_02140 [Cyanobacteria bacterium P01_H01_bin.35]